MYIIIQRTNKSQDGWKKNKDEILHMVLEERAAIASREEGWDGDWEGQPGILALLWHQFVSWQEWQWDDCVYEWHIVSSTLTICELFHVYVIFTFKKIKSLWDIIYWCHMYCFSPVLKKELQKVLITIGGFWIQTFAFTDTKELLSILLCVTMVLWIVMFFHGNIFENI